MFELNPYPYKLVLDTSNQQMYFPRIELIFTPLSQMPRTAWKKIFKFIKFVFFVCARTLEHLEIFLAVLSVGHNLEPVRLGLSDHVV